MLILLTEPDPKGVDDVAGHLYTPPGNEKWWLRSRVDVFKIFKDTLMRVTGSNGQGHR